MIVIPVTELTTVDDLLKKVEEGDVCIITKEGNPIAEVLSMKQKTEG